MLGVGMLEVGMLGVGILSWVIQGGYVGVGSLREHCEGI